MVMQYLIAKFRLLLSASVLALGFTTLVVLAEVYLNSASKSYNWLRPKLVSDGGSECLSELDKLSVSYKALGDQPNGNCSISNAVRVTKFRATNISSPLLMNCRAALQTARWLEAIEATDITHMGTYNCRKQRGSELVSEHSFANAIDVSAINGANLTRDWKKGNAKSEYLLSAQKRACDYFNNVVGPDDNKAHEDHFHLDLGPGVGCLPLWAKHLKRSIISKLRTVF
jgi:hypothetical protein